MNEYGLGHYRLRRCREKKVWLQGFYSFEGCLRGFTFIPESSEIELPVFPSPRYYRFASRSSIRTQLLPSPPPPTIRTTCYPRSTVYLAAAGHVRTIGENLSNPFRSTPIRENLWIDANTYEIYEKNARHAGSCTTFGTMQPSTPLYITAGMRTAEREFSDWKIPATIGWKKNFFLISTGK